MKPNKMQHQLNKMKKFNEMVRKDMQLKRCFNLLRSYYFNTKRSSLIEIDALPTP
jgi:UDP-N-acetylglucosamine pyrophosphorylase